MGGQLGRCWIPVKNADSHLGPFVQLLLLKNGLCSLFLLCCAICLLIKSPCRHDAHCSYSGHALGHVPLPELQLLQNSVSCYFFMSEIPQSQLVVMLECFHFKHIFDHSILYSHAYVVHVLLPAFYLRIFFPDMKFSLLFRKRD